MALGIIGCLLVPGAITRFKDTLLYGWTHSWFPLNLLMVCITIVVAIGILAYFPIIFALPAYLKGR